MPRTRGRARPEVELDPQDGTRNYDREEEEYEMEEKPARRRGRRRDVEEFVEGRKDSRRRNRGTSRDEDEDYDEETGTGTVSSGWGAVKKNKAATSSFPEQFKVGDDEILIAFLEEGPFATYLEHFLNELPQGQRKSFVCHEKGDCPLCDMLGDKPASRAAFNVVDFTDPDKPELKVWLATPGPLAKIEARADSKRTSPLNRDGLYFVVSKEKGRNGFFQYTIDPVREEEIEDDFEVDPEAAAEAIDKFSEKLYDKSIVKLDPKRVLREIAEGLED